MIRRLLQRLRRPPCRQFDLVNDWLLRHGDKPLSVDHAVADASVEGAKRFVLGILLRDVELRSHFPAALCTGLEGEFHYWLVGAGGGQAYGLTDRAEEHLTTLFQQPPTPDVDCFTDNALSLTERLDAWPTESTLSRIDRLWMLIVHDELSTKT